MNLDRCVTRLSYIDIFHIGSIFAVQRRVAYAHLLLPPCESRGRHIPIVKVGALSVLVVQMFVYCVTVSIAVNDFLPRPQHLKECG